MNAQYDALLEKMTVKSNNVNAIKELYLTCSPEMKEGKTYNITYVNPMGYKRNSIKFNCKLEKPK